MIVKEKFENMAVKFEVIVFINFEVKSLFFFLLFLFIMSIHLILYKEENIRTNYSFDKIKGIN